MTEDEYEDVRIVKGATYVIITRNESGDYITHSDMGILELLDILVQAEARVTDSPYLEGQITPAPTAKQLKRQRDKLLKKLREAARYVEGPDDRR